MISDNPNINDLLNIINKKRKQNKEVNVDLQMLCLKKLENMTKIFLHLFFLETACHIQS